MSFDTFDNRDATDYSITLSSKHRDYAYTNHSRTFLCGTDQNDYSEFALEWLIDELVEDGDEIVCLRVIDPGSKINSDASVQQGKYKAEAYKLLEQIKAKNKDDEKSINLVLEYAVGKVPETIQRMVCDALISFATTTGEEESTANACCLDYHICAGLSDCRYARSVTWWHSKPPTWLRIQILPAEFPRSGSGRSPFGEA